MIVDDTLLHPDTPTPDTKISPHAYESPAGANQEATAGAAGGAGMMIHQGQIQYFENEEEAKAEQALKEIEPEIKRLVSGGQWVAVRVIYNAPKVPSFTAFVHKERSDINNYAYLMLTHGDTKEEALREKPATPSELLGPPETYEAPRNPLGADRATFVYDTKIYPAQPVTVTDTDFIDIHDRVVAIRTGLRAIRGRIAGESVALDYLDAAQRATDIKGSGLSMAGFG